MNNLLNRDLQEQLLVEQQGFLHDQSLQEYGYACDRKELLVVTMYNLIPYRDGDKWCVLLGKDIQSGIAGFGKSPIEAIRDFNAEFNKELRKNINSTVYEEVNQPPSNLGGSFLSPERVKEVEFNNIIDKNLEITRSLEMAKKDIKIDKIITLVMFWVYALLTLVVLIAWNMMGQ